VALSQTVSDKQPTITFRDATANDINELVKLENISFETDRLTHRNFRWMITKANAHLMIAEVEGQFAGYGLALFHEGTSLARLYSIAMYPHFRGFGLGRKILEKLEEAAAAHDCVYMRLEVRPDNASAIRLYENMGYRNFSRKLDYYEDHADALCYEKRIQFFPKHARFRVPYYRQTTDFTCGPASLIMAMAAFDKSVTLTPHTELQIWREATTIFMTSGHGGCGPHGLALAAWRRGFRVELFVNQTGPLFTEGVRSQHKKEVLTLVHQDFVEQIKHTDIKVKNVPFTLKKLQDKMAQGGVPVVLISSYRINRSKSPHWVVLTASDERFMYLHDPEVDEDAHKMQTDCMHVPIRNKDFEIMTKFGRSQLKAAVIVYPRASEKK